MNRMDFAQAVTRTRVLETRLLSRARIERMVDARDIDEALKILAETEYQSSMAGVARGEDYERILSQELKRVYKLVGEMTTESSVVEILSLKYDYHNLKVLVKETAMKADFKEMYVNLGGRDIQKVKAAYAAGDLRDVEPRLRDALIEASRDMEATGDPQRTDIILDRHYFSHVSAVADESGIPLFTDYVRTIIDFTNVKTLVRVKRLEKDIKFLEEAIIEGGSIPKGDILLSLSDSLETMMSKFKGYKISDELRKGLESYQRTMRLSEFERILDNYLMKLNLQSKSIVFGPEPVFSYLAAKEAEMKALRIIMVSKLNKISPESIRERLRELYV
ncbi:V-type ATP synthase subunit C [Youngiibacter fragilis]|uniref:ATPase n=1 Tax=Youngiibacter fragilis 232.1 TaxID=994573 RepID=V7I0S3_9CLOT|nr:V-type ATP synthase subunit C [Youngiibacter fragilis]ETA79840.1 ATPase [Youngiibacter fragilis 232.1]